MMHCHKTPNEQTLDVQNPENKNVAGHCFLFGLNECCNVSESNMGVPLGGKSSSNLVDINLGFVDSGCIRSEEVELERTVKDEELLNKTFHGTRKLEVCGGNISLYVDLSGSLSGVNSDPSAGLQESGEICDVDLSRFEPLKFVSQIKELALNASNPAILELTIAKNRLAAFYRFFGHAQLPVEQLKESTNDQIGASNLLTSRTHRNFCDGNVVSSEPERHDISLSNLPSPETTESVELRERKKSKYLMFPYIDVENKVLPNELADAKPQEVEAENVAKSPPGSKSRGTRFQKKWIRKFVSDSDNVSTNLKLTNASAADLLPKLCHTAVNCQYPNKCKNFDIIEWFFSKFRISAFHDESICEPLLQKGLPNPRKKMQKKLKKDKSDVKDVQEEHTPNVKDVQEEHTPNVQDEQQKDESICEPLLQKGLPNPRKKMQKKLKKDKSDVKDVQEEHTPNVKDVQEEHTPNVQDEQQKDEDGNSAKPENKSVDGVVDVNMNIATHPGIVAKENSSEIGPPTPNGIPAPKKRKRGPNKPKDAQNNPITGIPDLNGNGMENSGSVAKRQKKTDTADVNSSNSRLSTVSVELKLPCSIGVEHKKERLSASLPILNPAEPPEKRKRRTKKEMQAMMPDIKTNGETQRTALLLSFAPGVSVPSKEVLLSTFCGFGPLSESEVFSAQDVRTAQVVFIKATDAAEAVKRLESSNPFGVTLVSHRLKHLPAVAPARKEVKVPAISKLSIPSKRAEAPPVDFMRQNLEMMTSMLEKSGDKLSPEMRAKLEFEIKSLLKKVNSLPGSSSS